MANDSGITEKATRIAQAMIDMATIYAGAGDKEAVTIAVYTVASSFLTQAVLSERDPVPDEVLLMVVDTVAKMNRQLIEEMDKRKAKAEKERTDGG